MLPLLHRLSLIRSAQVVALDSSGKGGAERKESSDNSHGRSARELARTDTRGVLQRV